MAIKAERINMVTARDSIKIKWSPSSTISVCLWYSNLQTNVAQQQLPLKLIGLCGCGFSSKFNSIKLEGEGEEEALLLWDSQAKDSG